MEHFLVSSTIERRKTVKISLIAAAWAITTISLPLNRVRTVVNDREALISNRETRK